MFTLLGRPKTHKVTKALAKQFAEMEPAPHDRLLSERRLQVYQRLFAEGTFRPCTWAMAHCKNTGEVYRVNGKHTSIMLSGLENLPEYYVTVEEYDCDTLEDVARLYATFDSKMMSRTTNDINMSFASTVRELVGISRKTINVAVGGMSYHIWQGGFGNHQPAERAELLLEHTPFVQWLHVLFLEGNDRNGLRHMARQAPVAAMFGCWLKAKGAATEFWNFVRDETGIKPDCPDRKLARYLRDTSIGPNSRSVMGVKRSRGGDLREFYARCLHAWNAWRRDEKTELRYFADKKLPSIV